MSNLDYKIRIILQFGQIINLKENKSMPTSTSLDEKLSDIVGNSNFKLNDTVSLSHNFAVDQNYNDINYNEFGASFNANPFKINFNFMTQIGLW